ncbi:Peptidase M16 inactive domain protein [Lentilactobacillus parabuchneri]|uniref:Peptidase M16 inactive domain protein n=2 Tax=Lentilactobacillus parabuchneri TaxID=152331 RepID=A0A1X1FC85_9LACO|nr:pitrilysin family protein [Lentilactobacillus parabuchneri]APR08681.1 Peptidase M16 inactive domain protein [Lentilactobacillus parabuchneri]KRM47660.1 peptidase M16 domain-containing protein [Lentilactobacillus parabuchneri DSM 5707 = NBRC 107865]KRN80319.1 peptidase M16 domain-containing protein [Lentilactobacillus parabuchneri]MBW0221733.1 insulinase family protein [Lentilactobacillus parabuchneri]MBW0245043.1 insulinase family protein [Lentilactobacillus parabuchneri]
MEFEIAKDVHLTTIPTTKFKNSKIVMNFTFPAHHENYAKLALLAELLENCSAQYDSELLVSRQLSKLYGASFGVTVLRYGNQHTLQVSITFPNDKYLPEGEVLTPQILAFLREMIENPFIDGDHFNDAYFEIHQKNVLNYLDSIADNKEFFSTLELQRLYYPNDPDHGHFLMGNKAEMAQITAKSLYDFYKSVLASAKVTILVAGDLSEQAVIDGFKDFDSFSDRAQAPYELRVIPKPIDQVQEDTKFIEGSQSVLSMAYELPIYFGDGLYFAAVIFNQLFGGSSQSLLFANVREKRSLAYDIHSSYNSLVGMDSVQAGIDYQNEQEVISMVNQQLEQLSAGNFSDALLDGVKEAMINQHRSEADHLGALIEARYVQQIMQSDLSDEQWEAQIQGVNRDQISQVAKQLRLRAIYQLNSGGQSDGNH